MSIFCHPNACFHIRFRCTFQGSKSPKFYTPQVSFGAKGVFFWRLNLAFVEDVPHMFPFALVKKAYYRLFQFSLRRSGMLGLIYLHLKLLQRQSSGSQKYLFSILDKVSFSRSIRQKKIISSVLKYCFSVIQIYTSLFDLETHFWCSKSPAFSAPQVSFCVV